MREIPVKSLTPESFTPFGSFLSLLAYGDGESGYFPDLMSLCAQQAIGVSIGYVMPCERRVPWIEAHDATWEARLPLDGDIILYVAPPGPLMIETLEAFWIPAGTLVKLNGGTVHGRQFSTDDQPRHVLLMSEQGTSKEDCRILRLEAEKQPILNILNGRKPYETN